MKKQLHDNGAPPRLQGAGVTRTQELGSGLGYRGQRQNGVGRQDLECFGIAPQLFGSMPNRGYHDETKRVKQLAASPFLFQNLAIN